MLIIGVMWKGLPVYITLNADQQCAELACTLIAMGLKTNVHPI